MNSLHKDYKLSKYGGMRARYLKRTQKEEL